MKLAALAPAKLNLFLHVTGRRDDGFHDLQSLFTLIDLYDELAFSVREDGLIQREGGIPTLPYQDDLVVKAALLLQQETGTFLGADITLTKHIPSGAGLGGGSSDAATALMALNRLWKTGLTQQALARLGLRLGADVPFFIFGQTAIAEGIGEKLQAFSLNPIYYLVIRPQLFISTPSIFKHSELCRNSPVLSWEALQQVREHAEKGLLVARNDLEPVAFALFPTLGELMLRLRCEGFYPRMTGSGACFFIPYVRREKAEQEKLRLMHLLETEDLPLAVERVFLCKGVSKASMLFYPDNSKG